MFSALGEALVRRVLPAILQAFQIRMIAEQQARGLGGVQMRGAPTR